MTAESAIPKRSGTWLAPLAALALALPLLTASAQQKATAAAAANAPDVGQLAPDFSLAGATRYGLIATPTRLSDLRGQTVVLAFFFQARTKG